MPGSPCRSPARRDRDPRASGDGWLLEPARRDRQGHDARRFFKSGDIGIMDESGYTKIVDRKKDMIIVSASTCTERGGGGRGHAPGVVECAAIGVPDAKAARR